MGGRGCLAVYTWVGGAVLQSTHGWEGLSCSQYGGRGCLAVHTWIWIGGAVLQSQHGGRGCWYIECAYIRLVRVYESCV